LEIGLETAGVSFLVMLVGIESGSSKMAAIPRQKTKYPGVFYRVAQRLGGTGQERVYYIVFKKNGKVFEEKVGRQYANDMTAAKAAAQRNDRLEGRQISRKEAKVALSEASPSTCKAIGELWDYFQAHRAAGQASPNGLKVDSCNYNLYLKPFEKKKITDLVTADILELKENLFSLGKSPQTVKHILGLLRRIIRFNAKNGQCTIPDPSRLYFDMPKVDNQKTEFLTLTQLESLKKALDEEPDQDTAAFIRLALATGMRKGAIIGLCWDDIDFERGYITLRGEEAKNKKTLQIPLNATARTILERVSRTESAYVFPGRDGGKRSDFRRVARRVKEKAGLPDDFRPLHGLRHTFASYLASSGEVNLYTIQRLLTHSSPQTTQRYAHLADEAMQKAANVIDDVLKKSVR
jgi:integrase